MTRLLAFAALSVVAHAIVLLARVGPADTNRAAPSLNVVLAVSIEREPSSSGAASPPPHTEQQTFEPLAHKSSDDAPTSVLALPADDFANIPEESVTSDESKPANTRGWLQWRISEEFRRYFRYPALARQRDIEGEVILAYRVEPDGRLQNVALAKSSGHALLDRAALADLNRVPPLTDAIARLQGVAMEDTLAVTYRLRDN